MATEEQIKTLWSRVTQDVTRPDVTLKSSRLSADGRPPGSTSSISSRLHIREQVVAGPNVPSELPPHYELKQQIGRGGMGVVHRARQTSADRTIALKMIRPEFKKDERRRDGFLAEAVATANLDHPNIVPVYDVGTGGDGEVFYTMKDVQGTEWREVLPEWALRENLQILMRVSDAVAYAHSKGIIHRDLKPENVMLGEFGEVLVMDWGLAAAITEDGKAERLDEYHAIGGTPTYMPPEMARGETEKIGVASDIYLLGAILFEIVTGKPPHGGDTADEALVNAARNEIVEYEQVGELLEIALKAMATDPSDRYLEVKEFQDALSEYQAHEDSLNMCTRAEHHLSNAGESGDYEEYSRAVYGFKQAVETWDGNDVASDGLVRASLAYAQCAISRDDLDLAHSLLAPDEEAFAGPRSDVERRQRSRAKRLKTMRTLRHTSTALTAVLIAVLGIGYAQIRMEEMETRAERDRAILAEGRAREAEKKAAEERDKAIAASERAEQAEDMERMLRIELSEALEGSSLDSLKQSKVSVGEPETVSAAKAARTANTLADELAMKTRREKSIDSRLSGSMRNDGDSAALLGDVKAAPPMVESASVGASLAVRQQRPRLERARTDPNTRAVSKLILAALNQQDEEVVLTPPAAQASVAGESQLAASMMAVKGAAYEGVVARLKRMCELDPLVTGRRQTGQCNLNVRGHDVTLRLQTRPGRHGEEVRLSIIDKK